MKTFNTSSAGPSLSYTIRPAAAQDLDEILNLLRLNLSDSGVTKKNIAFWSWKHEKSPAGSSYVYVAQDTETGSIVGLRALMRWRVRTTDGHEVTALRPVDTATHPDWQRCGVFRNLTLGALNDLRDSPARLIFNTPNEQSLPGYLRMGWGLVQRQVLRLRLTGLTRVARNWMRPLALQRGQWRKGKVSITPVSELQSTMLDDVLAFCAKADAKRSSQGLRLLRDEVSLHWRYCHPSANYHVLVTRDSSLEGCIDGVVFFRFQLRSRFRFALITDYFAAPKLGFRLLLRIAVRRIDAAFLVASSSQYTAEDWALVRLGFLPAKRISVAARWVSPSDRAKAVNNWDLTLADLEIF